MTKLTQKNLLDEGFVSAIRKVTKPVAKGIGAAAGALKAASDAGTGATWSGVAKGAAEGWKKEKKKQEKGEKGLDKALEEFGYIRVGDKRGKGDTVVVDVAQLDYNDKGKVVPGKEFNQPLVAKWDKEKQSWSVVRKPRGFKSDKKSKGREPPDPSPSVSVTTPETAPTTTSSTGTTTTITASYSQKKLLRQLTLLSD